MDDIVGTIKRQERLGLELALGLGLGLVLEILLLLLVVVGRACWLWPRSRRAIRLKDARESIEEGLKDLVDRRGDERSTCVWVLDVEDARDDLAMVLPSNLEQGSICSMIGQRAREYQSLIHCACLVECIHSCTTELCGADDASLSSTHTSAIINAKQINEPTIHIVSRLAILLACLISNKVLGCSNQTLN